MENNTKLHWDVATGGIKLGIDEGTDMDSLVVSYKGYESVKLYVSLNLIPLRLEEVNNLRYSYVTS